MPVSPGSTEGVNASTIASAGGVTSGQNRGRFIRLVSANMNSTADQAISGFPAAYQITKILIDNASANLTTAVGGFYTATAKGGSAIVAAVTTYVGLTSAIKFSAPTLIGTAATDVLTGATIYFSLTTPQGSAATADIWVFYDDLT